MKGRTESEYMPPKPKNRIAGAKGNWQNNFLKNASKKSREYGFMNKNGSAEALRNSGMFSEDEIRFLEQKRRSRRP